MIEPDHRRLGNVLEEQSFLERVSCFAGWLTRVLFPLMAAEPISY